MIASAAYEEWGYPGWILPVINTIFFLVILLQLDKLHYYLFSSLSVILMSGTSRPPNVSQSLEYSTNLFSFKLF